MRRIAPRRLAWLPFLVLATIAFAGCATGGASGGGSAGGVASASATSSAGATVDVFSLEVGDCLTDDPSSGATLSETGVIDCTQPHRAEVYSSSTVPDGDGSYPGDDAITAQAQNDCVDAFTTFDGRSYTGSDLSISYLVPTATTWESGDRVIDCLVQAPTGTSMGSLQGSNR